MTISVSHRFLSGLYKVMVLVKIHILGITSMLHAIQ